MLTTFIYVLGALSLQFTDMRSENDFFALLLPFCNLLFFIFLVWQFIFYFAYNAFSHEESESFSRLLYLVFNLDHEMERNGAVHTLYTLGMMTINAVCLVLAVSFYFSAFLDFVRL